MVAPVARPGPSGPGPVTVGPVFAAFPGTRGRDDREIRVLVRALAEVLAGRRPITQLRRRCSTSVYDDIGSRLAAAPDRVRGRVRQREQVRLLRVQVRRTARDTAQVSAVAQGRHGVRALGLGLRLGRCGWTVTGLDLG
jgi:hypothetical protein